MAKKKKTLPAEPINLDLVIVSTDDNEALYVNGRKLAENEEEKTPLASDTFLSALVGHMIKSVKYKELQNYDSDEYFPTKLEDALQKPLED